jgi:hypothetical protein
MIPFNIASFMTVALALCVSVYADQPECKSPLLTADSTLLDDLLHDPMAGYTNDDLWTYYLDCDSLEGDRPVHNESIWMLLRGVYQGIVGPARSSILQPLSTNNGFAVDFLVKQSEGKGRGVFAAQDIAKGQLVYSAAPQMAKFHHGFHYRKFLQAIPRDLACGACVKLRVMLYVCMHARPTVYIYT